MVELGSVAAYLALAISIGNSGYAIWNESKKPQRGRQQDLRDRLRQVLTEAQDECKFAIGKLSKGETPDQDYPAALEKLIDRIDGVVQNGLNLPGPGTVRKLRPLMDLIDLQWRDERSAYANVVASPYPNPEQAAKRLSAAQTALLNRLNDVQAELRAFIAVLTEIDENPRKARRDYSR